MKPPDYMPKGSPPACRFPSASASARARAVCQDGETRQDGVATTLVRIRYGGASAGCNASRARSTPRTAAPLSAVTESASARRRKDVNAFGEHVISFGIKVELAVKPQEVIPGQTESADRWLACEANMRPVPVVAMEPSGQRGISLL